MRDVTVGDIQEDRDIDDTLVQSCKCLYSLVRNGKGNKGGVSDSYSCNGDCVLFYVCVEVITDCFMNPQDTRSLASFDTKFCGQYIPNVCV